MSANLTSALAAYAAARGGPGPFLTPIPGVAILRVERPLEPRPLIHRPALCLVAQGAKRSIFGDLELEYRAGEALVTTIETPTTAWVSQASPERPFLGMVIELDVAMMLDVLAEIGGHVAPVEGGVFVAPFGAALDACAVRLAQLLEQPAAIPVVAPLIMRELSYWLLTAPYGERIAGMIVDGSRAEGIVTAIRELRTRYAESIRIEDLAAGTQMSVSTFHRQFKTVTSMTPLQYQKQLRLVEARRLMLEGVANAETAAFRVGYESQSQFSREYARMFGAPPRRDMLAARARIAPAAGTPA
jgi:AraC-like DNA-binding protein